MVQITGFRDIRAIDACDPNVMIFAVPVEGDSLKPLGIHDGDHLICRTTHGYESDRIGVRQTPSGRTAKFAFYDQDGFVVLHNDNGWRETWEAHEIKLLGLVIRSERDYE